MQWSYSRVNSFADCNYKWYLRYIKYPHEPRVSMFFANYGGFVHELAADFYAGKKSAGQVYQEYLTGFRKHVNAYMPNKSIFNGYFSDGARFLKDISMPEEKVLAVEQEVHFNIDGHDFIGFIDRVDQAGNGDILVVDHKSRKLKRRSTRAKPTKSDEELDSYLKQLYIYSGPVKELYGKFPEYLCFNCFRTGEVIKEPFNREAYRNALSWASSSIDKIIEEEEFRPDVDYFKCNFLCEMNNKCEYFQMNKRR